MDVNFESKQFHLRATSETSRKIEIDLTSDVPHLEKIFFKVESIDGGFESVFQWGTQSSQKIEVSYKNDSGNVEILAKALADNHIDIKFNAEQGTFDLDSRVAGKEMKVNVILAGSKLQIEITEPFFNNGKVTFEGM